MLKGRGRQGLVIGLTLAAIAVVAWAYLAGYLAAVPAVVLWAIAVGVDVILFVLSWLSGKKDEPELEVVPLPHKKGWMEPTMRVEDWQLYLGDDPRLGTKPSWGRPSDPERVGHGIHPAQVLEVIWPDPKFHPDNKAQLKGPDNTVEIHLKARFYKFAVLSIRNHGGEAERCSVHGWYRLGGDPTWMDLGEMGWYSRSMRIALKRNFRKLEALASSPHETLSDVLGPDHIDVPKGATETDECDLTLFYMLVGTPTEVPYVLMAAAGWNPIPAKATKERPLVLRIKLRFRASGMEPFTKWYKATVAPDDFKITEEKASD